MAGLAGIAEQYFSSLNPIASRIHSDIVETKNAYENLWETLNEVEKSEIVDECIIKPEIAMKYAFLDPLNVELATQGFNKNDILSYFDVQCGQKVIRDDAAKFRDEHSSPFSFHTRSQLDLCSFAEKRVVKQKPRAKSEAPILKSELELSHSKVLSELKNALKSNEKFESNETKESNKEFSPRLSKVADDFSSGFISKLIGNKRQNKGSAEEREHLVSPGRQCHIVASSDNYFKTNFHSGSVGVSEAMPDSQKSVKEMISMKGIAAYRNSSAPEEANALLGVGSSMSGDIESSLCDTPEDSIPCSLPKTGLDFLDNW